MSYVRAEDILPKELIEAIQKYVNGQAIYIPTMEKKLWGSMTDTKQFLSDRNEQIFHKHEQGVTTMELAMEYALSEKSVQRIIRNIRKQDIAS